MHITPEEETRLGVGTLTFSYGGGRFTFDLIKQEKHNYTLLFTYTAEFYLSMISILGLWTPNIQLLRFFG